MLHVEDIRPHGTSVPKSPEYCLLKADAVQAPESTTLNSAEGGGHFRPRADEGFCDKATFSVLGF